jgi:hypothetical protein
MTARYLLAHTFAAVATTVALGTAASFAGAQTVLGFGPAPSLSGGEWTAVGDAGSPLGTGLPLAGTTNTQPLSPSLVNHVVATTASVAYGDDLPFAAGAANVTGAEPISAGLALETAFGLVPGALDPDAPVVSAYEGSGFTRNLTVSAGDRLSFTWQFLTLDYTGADYAFAAIDGALIRLGGAELGGYTQSVVLPGSGGLQSLDWMSSSWQSGEFVFTDSGTVRIGFGVVDVGDFTVSSAIAVDDVVLTPVPEPAEWMILLAGLGAAGAAARRRSARLLGHV